MPFYEYRCEACGHEHEALQKMGAEPLTMCPSCGEPRLVKLISAAGFQLKGTGWYATDFKGTDRNKAGKDAGSKDSGDGKPAGGHSCGSGGCPACD